MSREQWEERQTLKESSEAAGAASPRRRLRISPAARKLAKEHGVDPSRIKGTGPRGRIVREDVMRAAEEERPGENVPVSRLRRSIADNMARSAHSVARVVQFAEVDMTRAVGYRKENRDLSYNTLLIKATACAMREDPVLNVSFEGDGIRRHGDVNIGLAVALDDGLITVSVKQADQKSLPVIAEGVRGARREGPGRQAGGG